MTHESLLVTAPVPEQAEVMVRIGWADGFSGQPTGYATTP
jgi:hypothetical protein